MFSKDFLSNGFWVTSRYVFTAISGIIITVGFARLATKETFGQYQLILSTLALFSVFTLPGLNMAALKAVSQKKPEGILQAVRLSFLFSFFALPFIFCYSAFIFIKGDHLLAGTLFAASLIFPFFYGPNTWYAYYEGRFYFKPVALRVIISSFAVTALIILGLFLKLNFFWLVIIYLLVSSGFSLIFLLQVRREVMGDKKFPSKSQLDLPYGRRVTIQKFVYTLSESLPPLTIAFFLGRVALANFQVANIFLAGLSGLIGAIAAIYIPKFFMEIDSDHRNIFLQNIATGILASIGYLILVRIIFIPMYGEKYRESFILAQLLAALPLIISLRTFLVNYFTARDKNVFIIVVYLIANTIAFICFALAARFSSFVMASATYLYLLNILLFLPLCANYFLSSKKSRLA